MFRKARLAAFAALPIAWTIGCGIEPEERASVDVPVASVAPANDERPAEVDSSAWLEDAPRDTWDAIYLQGKRGESKIGRSRTAIDTTQENGQTFVEIEQESHLEVLRYRETTEQSIFWSSRELPDGTFLSGESRLASDGEVAQTTKVRRVEEGLLVERTAGGATDSTVIPFPPGTYGYYGIDRSLAVDPMEPGETRTIRYVVPTLDQVVRATLTAVDFEETPLLQGRSENLLRIDVKQIVGASAFESRLWTTAAGEPRKSFEPLIGQTTYRTTKEIALQKAEAVEVDLGLDTVARANLSRIEDLSQATFDVRVAGSDASAIFPQTTGQRVEPLAGGGARVTVKRIRPSEPSASSDGGFKPTAENAPTEADLAPNAFLQSDDPGVQAFALSVASSERDSWSIAVAMERAVRDTIENKNLSQALLSAKDVLEKKEGDCTEHATLLAAALRARGIPSRIAIGLTYVPGLEGFAYHMWTEAWIDDRWIPLDATTARGGITASYLKLEDSSLAGASPFSVFLPAMRVLNRLQVETSKVEYLDTAAPPTEAPGEGTSAEKQARPVAGPPLPP